MDTATAKKLLQSNDLSELQAATGQFVDCNGDDIQIVKLQILLNSRILQLIPSPIEEQEKKEIAAKSYSSIGRCWMQMRDYNRAAGQMKKSLELDPNNISTLLLAGEALSFLVKFEEAVAHLKKAIELQTNDSSSDSNETLIWCYQKLAEVYERKGDFGPAVETLKLATEEFNGDNEDVKGRLYSQLGNLQEKLGDYKDAVDSLSTAVEALNISRGEDDPETQETAYLLEMARSFSTQ